MKILSTIVALILLQTTVFAKEQAVKVRIGWQIPWAIQGQLVQALKHSDILKKNNIEAEFIGKTAGPDLNELALAGAVDVILTADQPAAALFTKDKGWVGISRLMYNRTATYVPNASPIKSLEDLSGKTVGVPFGTAAQRIITQAIEEKKIKDVQFLNFGMLEHAPLIKGSKETDTKWGPYDALSGFDPIPAILEASKNVKTIHSGKVCALIVANEEFLNKNKDIAAKLIKSFQQAYEHYKKNEEKMNQYFVEEAGMKDVPMEAFKIAGQFEPNFKSKEIRTSFSDDDFALIQKGADFVAKATNKPIDIKKFVTNNYQPAGKTKK